MAAKKFLSGIDVASQKVVNMADGSSANDAATYGQMLALLHGLTWHNACEAASTANITITAPGTTIDGVTMTAGDRVLLKNQTTASQNGIYVYATSSTTMVRATDMDGAGEVMAGSAVFVLKGTVNAATSWVVTGDDTVALTIGTDAIPFNQFGAGGTTYSAGNGITLASTTFSVHALTNGGITVAAGGISVTPGNGIAVGSGGVSVQNIDTSISVASGGIGVELATNPGLQISSGLSVKAGTGITVDASGVNVTAPTLRYAALIGDGTTTSIAVTHSLGTRDVHVTVYDASTFAEVDVACEHTSTTVITLLFAVAPTSNQYRVVVIG